MRTTLQVPLTKSLKTSSEKVAIKYGFSSLQEAVRLFLTQLSKEQITIGFNPVQTDIYLTKEQENTLNKRYAEAKKETKNSKAPPVTSAKEMMHQLRMG